MLNEGGEEDAEKKEKARQREAFKEKKNQRDSWLGLEALGNCTSKEWSDEDCLSMIKEVVSVGAKHITEAALLRPKLTKDRFTPKFIAQFSNANLALKNAQDSMLYAQGMFQAKKVQPKFACKAIAALARSIQKSKEMIAECRA